jgi:hypothetical protein
MLEETAESLLKQCPSNWLEKQTEDQRDSVRLQGRKSKALGTETSELKAGLSTEGHLTFKILSAIKIQVVF